jgi:hypothetical protein
MQEPKTLREAIIYFSSMQNCIDYMVVRRWPDGVVCPTCGRKDARFLAKQGKWQCKSVHAKRQFSLKTGTVMEDSPIGLEKWLPAMWLLSSAKNGISSYELSRALGVTQKSAWFMLHRIRLAMKNESKLTREGIRNRSWRASEQPRRRGFNNAVVRASKYSPDCPGSL